MAGSRRITVEFLGDAKQLDKTAGQVDSKMGAVGGRMKKVGAIAGAALAGGLVVAGGALVKMARNAAEDEAAQRKLALALQNTTGANKSQVAGVEDWIAKQGKVLGVTDDELRPAFQRLAQATGDISKAQDLASVAMDASAGSGKSLEAVTTALAKAQNGNMGALSRLGIKIKDTSGNALTFDQVVKNLSTTFGGQASAAANSYDGKLNRMKVQFDETKETIGAKLLPVMGQLMDTISSLVDWTTRHSTATKIIAGVLAGLAVTVIAVSAAMKVAAAAQVLLNVAMSANPIGLVVIAIAGLVAGLIVAYKKSETFRDIVNGAFKTIADGARWMWNSVLKPTFNFLVEKFVWVADKIVGAAAWAFGWVPGLGPKLRTAAEKMAQFKIDVNREIDGVKNPKITVSTPGVAKAISSLQTIKTLIWDINHMKPSKNSVAGAQNLDQLLGGGRTTGRATGGHVQAGGVYRVNESGQEMFQPYSSGRIVNARRTAKASNGGGGNVVNLNFHGLTTDPVAVGREVRKALLALERATGRPALA